MNPTHVLVFGAVLTTASGASARAALQSAIPDELTVERARELQKRPEGWSIGLKVSGNGSYNHSSRVVGAVDGATIQLGLILDGSANLRAGDHHWENVLKIQETQTRTPQIDSFIKSADVLAYRSTYSYHFPRLLWLGPYARAAVNTQALHGYDVRAQGVSILRKKRDGAVIAKDKSANERIALTRPFEPLRIKEGVGVFAAPVATPELTFRATVGAAFQHIFVGDGFALADDASTPQVEFVQLEDATQSGSEVELAAKGKLSEAVAWEGSANFFFPFHTNIDTELEGVDLLNTELLAKISMRLNHLASLDYVVSAKRIPLILDAWQVQNGLVLTIGFSIL